MSTADDLTFPKELEPSSYRSSFADLADMMDDRLIRHYEDHGRSEGRCGNALKDRGDFVALIPRTASALEIGPFCAPVLKGERVKYFDVLDQANLERRAQALGFPHRHAPFIHFVSPTGDLSVVDETFDFVASSHCIEHQPDLISHLRAVSGLLAPGGRYFVLIPDKRYCFDHFMPESTASEVLSAYHERRKVHTLRSVIDHRAFTTHNVSGQHWAGQHGGPDEGVPARIAASIAEYEQANGSYIDVHAWQFTPDSMARVLALLATSGYIDLEVERIYPTRRDDIEFWIILRKRA